jgi:4-hydroxyacetophenone monooxygenase
MRHDDIQLITAGDEEIRAALLEAEIPPLLPALAHATGDMSLLRPELRANPFLVTAPQGGLDDDQLALARRIALEALVHYRDAGCPSPPPLTEGRLQQLVEHVTSGLAGADHMPLLAEELAVDGSDPRAPGWQLGHIAPGRHFKVAIIGAGMSGLLAAYRLVQAGIEVVILEKNEDVGGTWLENSYPGCRVDVSNHYYSYSFAQRDDWPQHFSTRQELLSYFRRCAEDLGISRCIRFGTEVVSAAFSDHSLSWTLAVRTPAGAGEPVEADAVISAVGQLNRPRMPDIAGAGSFAGESFHSARWDHRVDLSGKRVAVIGSAASAIQFVPHVAENAAQLSVFQRTANWMVPTPGYQEPVAPGLLWLFRHVPFYAEWHRFSIFWAMEGMLIAADADPAWQPKDRSVGAFNEGLRVVLTAYLEEQFGDRPDLLAKVVPDYPPAAKRPLRDDGTWARTLKRDNVELVTVPITEIGPAGVITADGTEHPADVIIYGTGFEASRFLQPIRVQGRGGADLHERWGADARAYMGITVPGFPNFFLLYGPNTNIVINGSIIFFSECEVRYVLGCLRLLLDSGHAALECRAEPHDEYNRRIDEGNLYKAWGVSSVNTWYKSATGRISQNWPFSLLAFWEQTLNPDPSAYEFLGASFHDGPGDRAAGSALLTGAD